MGFTTGLAGFWDAWGGIGVTVEVSFLDAWGRLGEILLLVGRVATEEMDFWAATEGQGATVEVGF